MREEMPQAVSSCPPSECDAFAHGDLWPALTTAPQGDIAARTFQVTHPFHPWHDRQFQLVAYKNAWGEDRVYFYNEQQQLIALPASWTDVIPADPFVSVAGGRALFRADDLLELAVLLRRLSGNDR